LVGAFLNLGALARWINSQPPPNLILVGAGTFENAAYEDTLAAGALSEMVWDRFDRPADSAQIAREIYRTGRRDLQAAVQEYSANARRLLAQPELRDDVPFALQLDTVSFVAELKSGAVVKMD
jgi:2-phosphosulfolactate phosphatase